MGTLVKLLLVAALAGLTQIDRLTAPLAGWLDARAAEASDPGVAPVEPAGAGERAPGFRTSHVRIPTAEPNQYDPLIQRHASQLAVRPELVRAVVQIESGFDPDAQSEKGAIGLMQLMPETAEELGVADPLDPDENIRGGVMYLNQLLRRFDGDEVLALAAYNAGPGAVARYGNRVPPFAETQQYVKNVRSVARAAARRRIAADDEVYKSYAIVDGWWTVVYSNAPPPAGHYEVTTEITPEDLEARTSEANAVDVEAGDAGTEERS